ncbi:MAG TPA: carbon-nitrogen hydrolase family protein [Labilithrix sp.]
MREDGHGGSMTSLAMIVAVIQLSSQEDVAANLARVRTQVELAARAGAELVTLPENFAFMGEESEKRRIAETLGTGPIGAELARLAREAGVWIVAGGMPEASDDPARPFNTSLLLDPNGNIAARYRKIHLFDVETPDGTKYHESNATNGGGIEAVVADVSTRSGAAKLGMSICYDLRFPELYRRLLDAGARIVTVPAAFTLQTGKDHWHVLLRARAIENQVFVLAPAQHGKHPRGRQTYGKSLVVDPWGDVLAQCAEGEGFAIARLDFAAQDRVRAQLPCLSHRRIGV